VTRLLARHGALVMLLTASTASGQTTLTPAGSISGPVDLIKVFGARADVTSGKTITLVDVSDPAAPRREGAYTCPELIWGFTVEGSTLYVAADTYGLVILDVSNPAAPSLVGALKTPGQAKNVSLYGRRAFVADHVAGIDSIDVSSSKSPKINGSFFVDGFAKDVVTVGRLAFAIDQPGGLYVFDLDRQGTFEPVATRALDIPLPLRAQLAVSQHPSTSAPALALVLGSGPIQIYDVSKWQAPAHATTFATPGESAQRIAVQGTRAFVSDGPAGLHVLDLTTPSMPKIVASFKTPTPARDVAVAGPLVFVSTGDQVTILRVSPGN
jgi:hypothetical protein